MGNRVDLKQVAQPYVGSVDDFYSALFPARTTAQLAALTDPINTTEKYIGRMVFDTTLGQPVWADGPLVGDTWSDATGTVSSTPA